MSTTDTPRTSPAPIDGDTASNYRLTFPRVIRSEWIKLASMRCTIVTFAVTGIAVAAAGVLVSVLSNGQAMGGGVVHYDAAAATDPTDRSRH